MTNCTYQKEPIKIGAVLPLTGERSDDAQSVKNGIDLAIKEVNQRNDLNAPIRVIYEDSKCHAKEAEKGADKLVLAEGVRVIIGDICAEATPAISKSAKSNTVVHLNLVPNITGNDFTFTVKSQSTPVFDELYKRVYNETPNQYAAQGYNAVKLLSNALQKTDYTGIKLKGLLSTNATEY